MTKKRSSKFLDVKMEIWSAEIFASSQTRRQVSAAALAPAGNPIYCPIGHQDVYPNFALTAAKFVFSNSGNFRAKANPPKPISCHKRPFGQWMGKNSSADWAQTAKI